MRHTINNEKTECIKWDTSAQPLRLPESAIHMNCFSLPGQYFQYLKGNKMVTDSCSFRKLNHGLQRE